MSTNRRLFRRVSLGVTDIPYFYKSASRSSEGGQMIVRSELNPSQVQSIARRIAHELDPNLIVSGRVLSEELKRNVAPVRFAGRLASVLGPVALLLAAVGVYGVVAFPVSQRAREIGIRMALGATRRSVQTMVFRQGARTVGIGLAIGLVHAAASSQALRSVLFGLSAMDGIAFAGVAIVLSIVAPVAVGIPSARASSVDPVASLRKD